MDVGDGYRRTGPDPFIAPSAGSDMTRRLRGRLAAPVTVWTAGGPDGRPAGITVSSVLLVEGDPGVVVGLVGPISEFWEAVSASRRFVVHVLGADQVRMADQFALRYPGDPFEGVELSSTDWGPVLDGVATRAFCSLSGSTEAGYFLMVQGDVQSIELGDAVGPLVHYRGRYVTVAARS